MKCFTRLVLRKDPGRVLQKNKWHNMEVPL